MKMTVAPTQVYSDTLIAIVRVTVDGQPNFANVDGTKSYYCFSHSHLLHSTRDISKSNYQYLKEVLRYL